MVALGRTDRPFLVKDIQCEWVILRRTFGLGLGLGLVRLLLSRQGCTDTWKEGHKSCPRSCCWSPAIDIAIDYRL